MFLLLALHWELRFGLCAPTPCCPSGGTHAHEVGGWSGQTRGLFLWTTPHAPAWGAGVCKPWLVPPSHISPRAPLAQCPLAVCSLFLVESFPSPRSCSLPALPNNGGLGSLNVVLNLNAASLFFTKIINLLQTELRKK